MSTTTLFPSEVLHDLPPLPECPSWFRQELYEDAKNIAIIIVLGLINAIVILGNLLVVMAVFASAKLRTVTNFLIVSLAISDLLVGLAVLPYSISNEVLEFWIFGELWCQMWLAVDVWLCTASILNLCAISIDRYLAITRPVHYRSIMSTKRVRLLIASVWVLSFIICFPPLVGWNDRVKNDDDFLTLFDGSNATQPLFRNFNYTTLRAIGNFTDDSNATTLEEVRYILRNATSRRCPKPQCGLITNPGYVIYSALGSFYIPMLVMLFFYYRIYVVALKTSRALDRGFKSTKSTKRKKGSAGSSQEGGSAGPSDVTLRIHRGRPTNESMPSSSSHNRSGDILVPRRIPTVVYHHSRDCSSASNSPRCFREDSTKQYYTATAKPPPSSELTVEDGNPPRNGRASLFSKSNSSSSSKRQARWHAKRFRTEAKATKTVGIIVGGFILCWLPFFTVYLIVGFCETCIPMLLFKVFFYLGYCNSALNPIIYGIISKDFRFAFRKILCRCTLNDDSVASLIRQIHMPTFMEENPPTIESTSGVHT